MTVPLLNRLQDIGRRVKRRGFVGAVVAVSRVTVRALSRAVYLRRAGYLTCTPVDGLEALEGEAASGITVSEARLGEVHRLEPLVGPAQCDVFRRRMEAGQVIIFAEADGTLVGYCCLSFTPTYAKETDCIVPVVDGEGYGHSAFTLPDYRRRGIYMVMLVKSLQVARERGLSRIRGAVAADNPAARAALRKINGRAVRAAGSVRILGLKRRWQRPLREGEQL